MLLYCFALIDMVTVFKTVPIKSVLNECATGCVSACDLQTVCLSVLSSAFDWSRPPVGEML